MTKILSRSAMIDTATGLSTLHFATTLGVALITARDDSDTDGAGDMGFRTGRGGQTKSRRSLGDRKLKRHSPTKPPIHCFEW